MTSQRQLDRIEGKIDLLLRVGGLQLEMEAVMDEQGTQLQQEVEKIDADQQTELAEVKAAGEAIVAAGAKFGELKALVEKQSTGALTDEEAAKLTALAGEVDSHIGEATAQLGEHVAQLNEESGAKEPTPEPTPTPEPAPTPAPAEETQSEPEGPPAA